jgi:hypothetical protein
LQYFLRHRRALQLRNPVLFTEKLQWYKLFYRNPLLVQCTDKIEVRRFVSDRGYQHILNEIYAVYEEPADIDLSELPESFVIKSSNGGGGRNVFFVRSKNDITSDAIRARAEPWFRKRKKSAGREWAYYHIRPRALAEPVLPHSQEHGLTDYKFYCFDGKPYCILLCADRFSKQGTRKGYFDLDGHFIDIGRAGFRFGAPKGKVPKPEWPGNLPEMLSIASDLSSGFPHVRVDLYNFEGRIYFGELTFYDASGYVDLGTLDLVLGREFRLPGSRSG